MPNNKKLLIILGATATGKTILAVKLARDFNGEIISADSRQVYQGMDIGTGKDLKEYIIKSRKHVSHKSVISDTRSRIKNYELRIKYHLIDIVSPKKQFNLAQWQKLALQKISEIQKRGKLPILCGGTGLYISSIVEGYQLPAAKPDKQLRVKLAKKSLAQLLAQLKRLDKQIWQRIDKKNRRRVERAIEIALQTKQSITKQKPSFDILQLGVKLPREEIYKKIDKRLIERLEQGMIKEIKELHQQGISWQRLFDFGLEYRWVSEYLRRRIDYDTMVAKLKTAIHHFAKRQMTWFRRDKQIWWVRNYREARKMVKEWMAD